MQSTVVPLKGSHEREWRHERVWAQGRARRHAVGQGPRAEDGEQPPALPLHVVRLGRVGKWTISDW